MYGRLQSIPEKPEKYTRHFSKRIIDR